MTTASPARELKKALKKEFPGIKFTVNTTRYSVDVRWEIELKTEATVAKVDAITSKYDTSASLQELFFQGFDLYIPLPLFGLLRRNTFS